MKLYTLTVSEEFRTSFQREDFEEEITYVANTQVRNYFDVDKLTIDLRRLTRWDTSKNEEEFIITDELLDKHDGEYYIFSRGTNYFIHRSQ